MLLLLTDDDYGALAPPAIQTHVLQAWHKVASREADLNLIGKMVTQHAKKVGEIQHEYSVEDVYGYIPFSILILGIRYESVWSFQSCVELVLAAEQVVAFVRNELLEFVVLLL